MRVQRDSRPLAPRGGRYGERLCSAVALVAISLFWLAQDVAGWVTALCWIGAVVGAVAAGYFGWRYARPHRDPR